MSDDSSTLQVTEPDGGLHQTFSQNVAISEAGSSEDTNIISKRDVTSKYIVYIKV